MCTLLVILMDNMRSCINVNYTENTTSLYFMLSKITQKYHQNFLFRISKKLTNPKKLKLTQNSATFGLRLYNLQNYFML